MDIINKNKKLCEIALQLVNLAVYEAEKAGLTDEPYYLDFEDNLNIASVKEHTADSE